MDPRDWHPDPNGDVDERVLEARDDRLSAVLTGNVPAPRRCRISVRRYSRQYQSAETFSSVRSILVGGTSGVSPGTVGLFGRGSSIFVRSAWTVAFGETPR